MTRVKFHTAVDGGSVERRLLKPGWYQNYAKTLCGRRVPLYLIGNPGDDPSLDCKSCEKARRGK